MGSERRVLSAVEFSSSFFLCERPIVLISTTSLFSLRQQSKILCVFTCTSSIQARIYPPCLDDEGPGSSAVHVCGVRKLCGPVSWKSPISTGLAVRPCSGLRPSLRARAAIAGPELDYRAGRARESKEDSKSNARPISLLTLSSHISDLD